MRIRRDSKPFKILKALAVSGGSIALSMAAPAGGAKVVQGLVREYFRKRRFEREKFLRDLKHLQKRELADYRELPNGEVAITLKKQGKEEMLRFRLDDMQLDKSKKWDGKWRLVLFDIPESMRKARDALRGKMKSLGFYGIQKSAFIIPYECERELEFVASVFGVQDHILVFHLQRFEGEKKLKHHFGFL